MAQQYIWMTVFQINSTPLKHICNTPTSDNREVTKPEVCALPSLTLSQNCYGYR